MPSISQTLPRAQAATRVPYRRHDSITCRHARSFTTSKPAGAVTAQSQMPKSIVKQMPAQQGMRSRMKNLSRNQIPNDLGLMPQTLIRPPRQALPKLFSADWKQRLKFEWTWTRTRFQNFFTLFYFLKWSRPKSVATGKKTKLPWDIVERTLVARNLHRQFYEALAGGNISTINKIACRGLIQSSQQRIGKRRAGESHSFHIMEYLGVQYPQFLRWPLLSLLPFSATKIVSDKVAPLPFGKNNLLRQCVIRIRTRQTLDRQDGTGPKTADLTEYVVLQRMRIEEQDEGWKIWGTTKPSTAEEIEKIMGANSTTPRFRDALQGQLSRLTGM